MRTARLIAIGIGATAILLVALLASRENTAQRSSVTPFALAPSVAPSQPLTPVKAPTPAIRTVAPSTLAQVTVTPIAALRGMGKLLFVCDSGLCLLDADGTNLKRIAPPDPGGQLMTPRWSPDGRVFAAQYLPHWADGKSQWIGQVVLFSADGALLASFSPGEKNELGQPWLAWSPDGRWFAFSTTFDESSSGVATPYPPGRIWLLKRKSWTEAFPPLHLAHAVSSPLAWSPDSHWLAFSVQSPPLSPFIPYSQTGQVYLFDSQSGQIRSLQGSDPSWGPDSKEFVFVSRDGLELQTYSLISGQTRTSLNIEQIRSFLAKDDPWLPKGKLLLALPAWSPDSSAIAFRVWGASDEPWPQYFPGMMFLSSLGENRLTRLPDTDVPNTGVQTWSQGGDRLAYLFWLTGDGRYYPNPATPSAQRRFTYKDGADLIIYDRKTRTWWDESSVQLQDYGELFDWSPDGKWFAAPSAGQKGLTVFSVEDPTLRWVNEELTAEDVQWQPSLDHNEKLR